MKDWRQFHDIFTSPPTTEDLSTVATGAKDKFMTRVKNFMSKALPWGLGGAVGGLGAYGVSRLLKRSSVKPAPYQTYLERRR
jgi:hypothetical protein